MTPTWLRRWRARAGNYFWLPCDLCGQYFAGYEWTLPHQTLCISMNHGVAVCRKCAGSEAVFESERRFGRYEVER
jgi:hypothetical protein